MQKNHQKSAIWTTIAQVRRAISSEKKLVKQQYLLHTFSQYGELGPLTAEIHSGV